MYTVALIMAFLTVLVFGVLVSMVTAHCPETEVGLKKWSDSKNTWNGSPPEENDNVTITDSILLDKQPPTLWSITIKSGGKLVWDPKTEVHLKIHWIRVDGEMHIGSEHCPFTEPTHITFLGNVKENDLGPGGDKALFVMSGGVLEIHGKPKMSWTKLTKTANKMSENNGLHVQHKNLDGKKLTGRGLVVYNINPTTGNLDSEAYFDFNKNKRKLPEIILNFVTFLNDIPTGNIVGIAVRRELVRKVDIDAVFKAIEIIAGQTTGTNPLRATDGAAYAMVTKKGSPSLTQEVYKSWSSEEEQTIAQVTSVIGELHVIVRSVCFRDKISSSFAEISVADDLAYRPILSLLDKTSSWVNGDKLILASTDYDWRQAEEVEVITCDTCTPYQVRLSAPLKYTHYGEIYKNVDMRGEIGLLSRNILFDSEDAEGSDTYGGNLKVLKGFKSVHIENAEFSDLGQQEVLGRYPLHFHMCDDVDSDEKTRPWLKHNSIHHSNSRCVTVHGTHGLIVEDNVCYLTMGHGYFLEDGGEKRTVLDGNLGLGTQTGTLIKADRLPSTFWVTNPISFVRNNVAAGGEGRGYWYAFPEIPIGPSADKGYMKKHEARHTAISEFDNNVAHSNRNHGLFFDNEFNEETDALGYNRYRPVEDPLWHLEHRNSTDKPAIFNRLTAYKNSPRNAWLRGGMLRITRASLSDSPQSLVVVKENTAIQFVEDSVLIGDSPNLGEVAVINGNPVSIGRSFPRGMSSIHTKWRTGMGFQNGPVYVKDVFFDDFADNDYYHMGAIGFATVSKQSSMHSVENAQFGFSDPSEGNRVQEPVPEDNGDALDDVRSVRDTDYSITGINAQGDVVTVVSPAPLLLTNDCSVRKNWNWAYCQHTYTKIKVIYAGSDNVMTMTRDDNYKIAKMDADSDMGASFLTIVGEPDYSYSMYWENEIPKEFRIIAELIRGSKGVRIGVCLPPDAEFEVNGVYPTKYMFKQWTNVTSVDDVDSPAEYFFDSETGYLAIYLQSDHLCESDDLSVCSMMSDKRVSAKVKLSSGDRSKTDCLDAVHKKIDLVPKASVANRGLNRLLNLLSRRTKKNKPDSRRFGRSVHRRSTTDTRELPATAQDPNPKWGAGATRQEGDSTKQFS